MQGRGSPKVGTFVKKHGRFMSRCRGKGLTRFLGCVEGRYLISRSLRKEEVIRHMLWGDQKGRRWAQPPNNLGDSARIGGW